jgi:hypothetical protein
MVGRADTACGGIPCDKYLQLRQCHCQDAMRAALTWLGTPAAAGTLGVQHSEWPVVEPVAALSFGLLHGGRVGVSVDSVVSTLSLLTGCWHHTQVCRQHAVAAFVGGGAGCVTMALVLLLAQGVPTTSSHAHHLQGRVAPLRRQPLGMFLGHPPCAALVGLTSWPAMAKQVWEDVRSVTVRTHQVTPRHKPQGSITARDMSLYTVPRWRVGQSLLPVCLHTQAPGKTSCTCATAGDGTTPAACGSPGHGSTCVGSGVVLVRITLCGGVVSLSFAEARSPIPCQPACLKSMCGALLAQYLGRDLGGSESVLV